MYVGAQVLDANLAEARFGLSCASRVSSLPPGELTDAVRKRRPAYRRGIAGRRLPRTGIGVGFPPHMSSERVSAQTSNDRTLDSQERGGLVAHMRRGG
jgi:hypothetical protein